MELLASSVFILFRNLQTFSQWLQHFTLPTAVFEGSSFSTLVYASYFLPFLPLSLKKFVFDMAILKGMEWCLMVLTCSSLIIDDDEHLFMCLLAVCMSYLDKCLFQSFAHLKIGLSFCCWVVRILYIFWIIYSYQLHDLQIFSPFLWIVFSVLIVSFGAVLMKSTQSFFSFVAGAFGVMLIF